MLTITRDAALCDVSGSTKDEFVEQSSAIHFGRSLDSQIRFPASDTRLGRNHFELRAAAGGYELVTDREHPVYMNGVRVIGTVPLRAETELRLIDATTGPMIKIVIIETSAGTLTDPHFKTDSGTVQQGLGKLRNIAAGLVVALVAVIGFMTYQWHMQAQLNQTFLAETTALTDKLSGQQKDQAEPNWAAVYEKIKPSIYQVAIQNNDGSAPHVQGTAWVNGPHTLATNAHVAMLMESLSSAQKLVVIAPDQAQIPIEVVATTIHPAYLAFSETIDAEETKSGAQIKSSGGYDVAQLTVAIDVKLAPALPIASSETLKRLRAGDAIAYAGYPAVYANNVNVQQLHTGFVSGTTDFMGVANNRNDQLIYHTATAVRGTSGSPVFNAQGEVVAVHSGGEVIELEGKPIVSGSGTFYAQSASLIADLETPWSVEKTKSSVIEWQNASLYLSHRNQVWALLQTYRDTGSLDRIDMPPVFESKSKFEAGTSKSATSGATMSWQAKTAGTYIVFALPDRDQKLSLRVMKSGITLQSPLVLDAAPTAIFDVKKAEDVSFAVTGQAGENYWLQVLKLDDAATKN
jgi:V8-like Glu-specific endopeptidase